MRYRIRYGDIIAELLEPSGATNRKMGVVIIPGLPNQPRNEEFGDNLAAEGFYVLQPRFIGSWESYGEFSLDNCIKTIIESIEKLKSGEAVEVWGEKKISWEIKEVAVVSSSFGSLLVLSSLDKLSAKKIVCLGPLINIKEHNTDKRFQEQDLYTLAGFLERGWHNAFRGFDAEEWKNFVKGNCMNPYEILQNVSGREILLLHGEDDVVVHFSRTQDYYTKIRDTNKASLKIYPGIGHGKILNTHAFDDVVQWLKNR
ncbi:alpha/beta hydrolase [Candidatus Pacearchaeota archaeon]|nr:alpha/beta hydrolase [Candidatus Pacearchaeota archaeon]